MLGEIIQVDWSEVGELSTDNLGTVLKLWRQKKQRRNRPRRWNLKSYKKVKVTLNKLLEWEECYVISNKRSSPTLFSLEEWRRYKYLSASGHLETKEDKNTENEKITRFGMIYSSSSRRNGPKENDPTIWTKKPQKSWDPFLQPGYQIAIIDRSDPDDKISVKRLRNH